ncbi:MAG: hypothetical protein CMG55_05210 [Candidatus Marinimicrobia bacterium]|nr:hypothetical protein [Candidatus Neomarinimicrobiota bacterium]|tara:strand:- start:1849 stop:3138 length:1290 start_codon:yes stop_codon:yes gene_type:complete
MSFMVLNTGRVASQYFYINLKMQKNVIMPSRYKFDKVVKSFIKRRYTKPFKNFINYQKQSLQKRPDSIFGIVFHSARRNLIYPLNSDRNIEFLKVCRDELDLNTIFFPVREPDKVFHSELNRQLARLAGDWSFPLGMNGWRKIWKINDCINLENETIDPDEVSGFLPNKITQNDLKQFSRDFIIVNSKIFSLYKLFKKVFDNVIVFDYSYLFKSPELVFSSMAKEAGFSISDLSLTQTRLNSLPNRFMIYNSFTLQIDKKTQIDWEKRGIKRTINDGLRQKISFNKIFREKQNPFLRFCRFKFEISKVISICEDWGKYKPLVPIPTNLMPFTQRAIEAELSLGLHSDDILFFSKDELDEIHKIIFAIICPRFDMNFKILFDYYKNNVYYKDIPTGKLYDNFIKINKQEFININQLLQSSRFLLYDKDIS